jgi:hypothetical protein
MVLWDGRTRGRHIPPVTSQLGPLEEEGGVAMPKQGVGGCMVTTEALIYRMFCYENRTSRRIGENRRPRTVGHNILSSRRPQQLTAKISITLGCPSVLALNITLPLPILHSILCLFNYSKNMSVLRCKRVAGSFCCTDVVPCRALRCFDAKRISIWHIRRAPPTPVPLSGACCHRHGQQRVYSTRAHWFLSPPIHRICQILTLAASASRRVARSSSAL